MTGEDNMMEKMEAITKTPTSRVVFGYLSNCNPLSSTTNILTFKDHLSKKFQIDDKDFYRTFDDLEAAEIGYFSSAQPNVFHWEYNLRDIADKIINPTKKINIRRAEEPMREPRRRIVERLDEVKPLGFTLQEILTKPEPPAEGKTMTPRKKIGRPPGAKNKPKAPAAPARPTVAPDRREKLTPDEAVVFLFTTRRGNKIPFRLDEVADLVAQAEEIKRVL